MTDEFIYTCDDLLRVLDSLLEGRDGTWWDGFFADASRFGAGRHACPGQALALYLASARP